MNLTDEQIRDIAGSLDCGLNVYININTHEVLTIPELDEVEDDDAWKEDIDKIQEDPDNFLCIEKLEINESVRILVDFVSSVEDDRLRMKLQQAVSGSKAFKKFKAILQENPHYMDKWYRFKEEAYIRYVEDVLERFNNSSDFDYD